MPFRRRRPERDIDDLKKESRDRELGWDVELSDERGLESHESTDRAAEDREPRPVPDD